MTIIERLKQLSEVGAVIRCPVMELLGGDHEPPVVVGEGEITVLTATSFAYALRGTPADTGYALRSLRRIEADPRDSRLRERLTMTTADGLELSGGWTIPKIHLPNDGRNWVFTGEIEALSLHENGAYEPGTEVAYLLPSQHRARVILRRFFPQRPCTAPEMRLTVLGSEVVFSLDDDANLLRVRVPATEALPATFTENWLGEPLRILFGQMIYPRFVARQSETWLMACIRPSPKWSQKSDACALWQGDNELVGSEEFWESYRRLLAYVAAPRDANGHPNFEANKITALYGEVIQAAHGSRWVWALTYASAVEAMVKLLGLAGQPRTDMDAAALAKFTEAVDEFRSYIDRWEGDPRLKEPAQNAASRMLKTSAAQGLRQLMREGWIKKDEFDAWDVLRNRVMHGSLVSPYSSAEEDKLLLDLAHLFHAMTRRLLAEVDPDSAAAAMPQNNSPCVVTDAGADRIGGGSS